VIAEQKNEARVQTAYTPSQRPVRRSLNSVIRFLTVIFLGILVAGAAFYLMRGVGY